MDEFSRRREPLRELIKGYSPKKSKTILAVTSGFSTCALWPAPGMSVKPLAPGIERAYVSPWEPAPCGRLLPK